MLCTPAPAAFIHHRSLNQGKTGISQSAFRLSSHCFLLKIRELQPPALKALQSDGNSLIFRIFCRNLPPLFQIHPHGTVCSIFTAESHLHRLCALIGCKQVNRTCLILSAHTDDGFSVSLQNLHTACFPDIASAAVRKRLSASIQANYICMGRKRLPGCLCLLICFLLINRNGRKLSHCDHMASCLNKPLQHFSGLFLHAVAFRKNHHRIGRSSHTDTSITDFCLF